MNQFGLQNLVSVALAVYAITILPTVGLWRRPNAWLPEAHPAAPSSISALMWAVLIKAGVYGLYRVCAFGLGRPDATWGQSVPGAYTPLSDMC